MSLTRLVLVVLLLLTPVFRGEAADQKASASQETPAPPPSPAIPLADVASRATEVEALLRTFEALRDPEPQDRRDPEPASRGKRSSSSWSSRGRCGVLRNQPTLEWLEGGQELWVQWQGTMTTWLHALTQRATQLQDGLTRLADEQRTWTQAQDAARAANAPGSILEQIAGVLAAIESAQKALLGQRATVLDLQGRVAQGVSRCETALAQIDRAQKQVLEGLLVRDHPPLWSRQMWGAWPEDFHRVRDNATGWWEGITLFLRNPAEGAAPTAVLFLVLAVLLWAVRRWERRGAAAGEAPSFGAAVFNRPFSAALLMALVGHTILYGPARPVMRDLLGVLLPIPVIRLTTPFVDPRVVPGLFMLGTLFAFDTVRRILAGGLILEPALLALEMLAGILALGYVLGRGQLRRPPERAMESERLRSLRTGAGLVLLLFAVSLGAAVLGYLRLGRLLASGVLGSAFLALLLGAQIRLLTGVAALVFLMWPVRLLWMVRHHRDLLERRTHRVLVWVAVCAWTIRSLAYVGLLGPVWVLGQGLLAAKVERGALSLSLEDVLAFVLTLWVAYLLVRLPSLRAGGGRVPARRPRPRPVLCPLEPAELRPAHPGLPGGPGGAGPRPHQADHHGRRVRRRDRLRPAERGEQLRLGADPALRAADPRRRHHRGGRDHGERAPDRHPLERGAHVRRAPRSSSPTRSSSRNG